MHLQISRERDVARVNLQAKPTCSAGFHLRAPAGGTNDTFADVVGAGALAFEQFAAKFTKSFCQRVIQRETGKTRCRRRQRTWSSGFGRRIKGGGLRANGTGLIE